MEKKQQKTDISRSKQRIKSKSVMNTLDIEENFFRREKRRQLETKIEVEKMRAELPEYNLNDIRMFKLPFHEALMAQLQETDYTNTEAYIKQLFQLNDQLRNDSEPTSYFWSRPLLKHSDPELKKLSSALMEAEDEHKKGNYRNETEILIKLAIDFAFNYADWTWLAEDLILQSVHNAEIYQITGKHAAISRYLYAKILYNKLRDYNRAEKELTIVRELSKDKSWNVKAFLPEDTDSSNTLFMNTNYMLYHYNMRQAQYFFKNDVNKALEFAILARKRATEACYHDGESKALYIKGQCELNLGYTKESINTFNKALYIQSRLKSEEGICEITVELSKAYMKHGSSRLAFNTLMTLKARAEKQGFQFYLAQAHRYLGEYYLNCGEPHKATPLLSDALAIFHSINFMAEADQVRNLGALSSGLELMPSYVGLIQQTDKRCKDSFENLIKLVKWKDSREPFWGPNKNLPKISETFTWNQYLQMSGVKTSIIDQDDYLSELSTIVFSKFSSNNELLDNEDPSDAELSQTKDEKESEREKSELTNVFDET
ncbi:hypothetical protein ABEB36_005742 [Hypothenemus hampei]|uniref:Tetratricopeptide repeat protein 29 n=1 Tax=Hypothenemus hampei TaxID=57062 RepID=A0ABD1EZA0_HYPHA